MNENSQDVVMTIINKYGTLPKKQLKQLCSFSDSKGISDRVFATATKRLMYTKEIVETGGGYYLGLPKALPDELVIRALWVFISGFAQDVPPSQHRCGDYPGQVFFVKGNCTYQIMVVQDRLEHEISLFPPLRPRENKKYIFVVSSFDREKYIEPYLPSDAPCVLATVTNTESEPEVKFKIPDCQKGAQ